MGTVMNHAAIAGHHAYCLSSSTSMEVSHHLVSEQSIDFPPSIHVEIILMFLRIMSVLDESVTFVLRITN